jgi:hypothetical protein
MRKVWKIYGAVPASSVSSERVFSVSGNLVRKRRNRLACDTIDTIMMLNSIQHSLPKLWKDIKETALVKVWKLKRQLCSKKKVIMVTDE